MKELDALKKKLDREIKARLEAEDLLEKKSLELYESNETLKYTNLNLEKIVESRTNQLEEAIEEANSANRAKSQFLANMSHEIRTPLNGILGFLEILRNTSLEEHQVKYLDFVDSSSKLLLSIVNDVLEFSKIEEGKLEISPEEMNLEDCLFDVISGLSNEIYKKKLESLVFIDEKFQQDIISDQSRIRQIIVNLIGNSIKFTPSGYISLRVFPLSKQSGEYFVMRVIDTGVGIPKEKLGKVFEDFTQVDVSDTRKYGGSGLGLSICKKISEAMGGGMRVRSLEGVGTIFDVVLPLEFSEDREIEPNLELRKEKAYVYVPEKKLAKNFLKRFQSWGVTTTLDDKSGLFFKLPLAVDEKTIFIIDSKVIAEKALVDLIMNNSTHEILLLAPPSEVGELKEVFGDRVEIICKPVHRKEMLEKFSVVDDEIVEGLDSSDKVQCEDFKILVAEDNLVNQQLMEALLDDFGFNYKIVANGREAYEATLLESYQLVLMDCQMPEMDGFEATKKIRESDKDLPILAMTANAFRSTKEKCFQVGMNSFITKPIKPLDLLKEIEGYK